MQRTIAYVFVPFTALTPSAWAQSAVAGTAEASTPVWPVLIVMLIALSLAWKPRSRD